MGYALITLTLFIALIGIYFSTDRWKSISKHILAVLAVVFAFFSAWDVYQREIESKSDKEELKIVKEIVYKNYEEVVKSRTPIGDKYIFNIKYYYTNSSRLFPSLTNLCRRIIKNRTIPAPGITILSDSIVAFAGRNLISLTDTITREYDYLRPHFQVYISPKDSVGLNGMSLCYDVKGEDFHKEVLLNYGYKLTESGMPEIDSQYDYFNVIVNVKSERIDVEVSHALYKEIRNNGDIVSYKQIETDSSRYKVGIFRPSLGWYPGEQFMFLESMYWV